VEKKVTGNIFDYALLKRVIKLAAPYKGLLYLALTLSIVLACLAPLRPAIIGYTIDHFIQQKDLSKLYIASAILIGLILLEFALRYTFTYRMEFLGQSIIRDLRIAVYKHVINLRLTYFDNTPIGTSTTRTINDIESINDIFAQGLISIIADLLMIVVVISVMLYTNWKLALISLTTLPLFIYATYRFKENIKSAFQKVRTQVSRINAYLQEHISGVRVVQIFNAEQREYEKFKVINAEHRDAHIESIWHYSVFFPIVEFLVSLSVALMVTFAAYMMLYGKLPVSGGSGESTGVVVSFLMLINMLYRPLRMMADKFNTLQMGLVASERVFGLLDKKDFISNDGQLKPTQVKGELSFEHVHFSYVEGTEVLKDISFHIEAGKTLAIVGATGSGKTSTINILSRFYEVNAGRILIDDIDIKDIELHHLRNLIGVVLQDVFLFRGTVYDNIALGNPNISMEQVIDASKKIGAHDFIMRLPDGYNYAVRERGNTLSVGQRQLISFVRALVANPSILILDEATSSVDTASEQMIQSAIEKLVKGRTSIVIAHRLSTIRHADKIMVLDKGEIKEIGSGEELLQLNGYYKRLYDIQFHEQKAFAS